jgi:serine phosphatase RsbU (regulator of sigma subunit)
VEERLIALAKRFWPELETLSGPNLVAGVGDVIGVLYSLPLVLVGVLWLIAVTDLALVRAEWPVLCLLFVLLVLFERFGFVVLVELKPGRFANLAGSLEGIITWSAALMFGPTALWLAFLWWVIDFTRNWRRLISTDVRWNLARSFVQTVAVDVFAGLVALAFYRPWGGDFPLPGLALDQMLPAFYVTGFRIFVQSLIIMPLILYLSSSSILALAEASSSRWVLIRFVVGALALPLLIDPFAVLASGLHTQHGLGVYLFFIAGVLWANLLAHQLSRAFGRSQQRSRELERLEQLGRAIIDAPPDASTLPDMLEEHVPLMFPFCRVEIRLFPDRILVHHPEDWEYVADEVWEWLGTASEANYFLPEATLPWDEHPASHALLVAPILDVESAARPIGGIYLCRRRVQGAPAVASLLPAVQSLAAQIASALHSAQVYEQTLAHQKVAQELALAGRIQVSFLPRSLPEIPGWQLTAMLEPARETSGDFYDLIPLPNGWLGILIADVADKGMGAALYMALSRTLIRTYAVEYDAQPELALGAANRRILMDTQADLFVSVFCGLLDPVTGTLTYCNAGHNPPYLLRVRSGDGVQSLPKTGMLMGIMEDATWEQRVLQLVPGDVLVLYTDGVTEAQNRQGEFFGEERMIEAVRSHLHSPPSQGLSAQDVHDALMAEIRRFVGDAPQFDDLTLMVVVRDVCEDVS